jgi:hypothetical protein
MSQRDQQWMQLELGGLTHWLIRQAAGWAPECLSSRLEEEWLADSESRFSALSRLRFAVGCCWATVVIVVDTPRSRVAAVRQAAATSGFVTLADRHFGYFSLRSGTLFLIVGIYAVVFCGVITTLSHTRGLAIPTAPQGQVATVMIRPGSP